MKVHGNAALGPAGRLALVKAIESGMTQKAAAAAFCVAPATAHRWWHRWRRPTQSERAGELAARSLLATPPPAAAAHGGRRGADPAGAPADQPRSRPPGGDLPPLPLDDLEGPAPPWPLPATQGRQGDLPPL